MGFSSYSNAREVLQDELERRCKVNRSYSLRAFSRDLGLSPATLSEALNGKHKISRLTAHKIATKLAFSESEKEYFVDLAEKENGRTKKQKELAQQKIDKKYDKKNYFPLSKAEFSHISDWYYIPILELANVTGFHLDADTVSFALGITRTNAKLALLKLEQMKLLRRNEKGELKPTHEKTATSTRVPSRQIQNFHCQILEKAKTAIVTQELEEREFSCSVLAIKEDKIMEAKKMLKNFRRKFCSKIQDSTSTEQLYCLSAQFFRLADLNFVKESSR